MVINMFDCNSDLRKFHNEKITLNEKQREEMRSRRKSNRERLEKGLQANDDPALNFHLSQGSYAMHTMVQDDSCDYDIDDGAVFLKEDLVGSQGAEKSALSARKMVCSSIDDGSFDTPPAVLKNCVRVQYAKGYHVDIPVYRMLADNTLELASSDWKASCPSEITEWYNNSVIEKSPDKTNGRQLRRITRLIKAYTRSRKSWKERMPSGFIVSALVVECYVVDERDDVSLVSTISAMYHRLLVDLEVVHPIYSEMLTVGKNDSQMTFLRDKFEVSLRSLDILFNNECTRMDALSAWKSVFQHQFWKDRLNDEENKLREDSKQKKACLLRDGNSSLAVAAGLIGSTALPSVPQVKQTRAYGGKRIGKRVGGPWYSSFKLRVLFERGADDEYPTLTVKNRRRGAKLWREYSAKIRLQEFRATRCVTIKMFPYSSCEPEVKVDGPSDSPHRYNDGQLCMWYPYATKGERWIFSDGLLHLLVMVEAHLFREAWWRESDEWLGPEMPHGEITHTQLVQTSASHNKEID